MKKNLFILMIFSGLLACNSSSNSADKNNTATLENPAGDPNAPSAEITFDALEKTLPTIEEGEEITILYNYTNTGKADLIIHATKGSCGCTSTEHAPLEPIAPGEKGTIRAVFSSSGKPQNNSKTITVTSNAPENNGITELRFNIFVNPKYN